MKTRHVLNVASLLSALCLGQGLMAGTLDLAGDWQVQLQPAWNEAAPMHKLHLPGSLQAQGLGEEISVNTKWIGEVLDRSWYTAARYEKYRQPGNVKIPFWLQPDRHFVGAAIYRRMIGIPQDWAGKRVCLSLERVHISSKVWLDGKEIGTGNSLSTPHRFDLGKLAPGTHKLEIGIDNGMPALVGENSHCVSDQMQTDWNGIVGKLPPRDLPLGQSSLGKIEIPLAGLPTPSRLKFVIGIADTVIENHWDIWVYPASTPRPTAGAIVITRNPAEAWQKVADGAAVLLIPSVKSIVDPEGPKVALGFSTIFWNSAWAKNQPPNTLGILCDPKHPAFAGFPTDFHSNYQWWYLIQLASKPLCLDGQAPGLRPIVQVIDDWFTAHRLGLVVEAKCGKGKLLVCAIDVENAKPDDIVAAQFRASLLGYMNSAAFARSRPSTRPHLPKSSSQRTR